MPLSGRGSPEPPVSAAATPWAAASPLVFLLGGAGTGRGGAGRAAARPGRAATGASRLFGLILASAPKDSRKPGRPQRAGGDGRGWTPGKASVAGGARELPEGVCAAAARAPRGGLGWERGHPRAEARDRRREGASGAGLILPRSLSGSAPFRTCVSDVEPQLTASKVRCRGAPRQPGSVCLCPSIQVSAAEGASLPSLRSRSVSPKAFSSCSAPWLAARVYPRCGDARGGRDVGLEAERRRQPSICFEFPLC